MRHLRGVDGRRDPGIQLVQRRDEFRDVGVLGLIYRGENSLDYPLVGFLAVTRRAEDAVGENAAQNGLVLVMVGVDEARHNDHPTGIDHESCRIQVAPDSEDLLSLDQHIAIREIADMRIKAQHDAAFQQNTVSRIALGAFEPIERCACPGSHGLRCEQLGRGDAGEPSTCREHPAS